MEEQEYWGVEEIVHDYSRPITSSDGLNSDHPQSNLIVYAGVLEIGPHYASSSQHCAARPTHSTPPRSGSGAEKSTPRQSLSLANCPTTFVPFMRLWSECVPAIQSLAPERQHDLARVICNLAPLEKPAPPPMVPCLAADLRAIAIEISQRRSFQDRYASDLQAAIDVGESPGGPGSLHTKASFVPPPLYTPSPTTLSPTPLEKSKRSPALRTIVTNITATSTALPFVTICVADVLASTPRLHAQLTRDPPRAYYGSVALAILAASARSVAADGDDGGAMWLVRGTRLTVTECPERLRPLMREFVAVDVEAALIEEEDTAAAMALAQDGRAVPVPRVERARLVLERGAGYDIREGEERDSASVPAAAVMSIL
ncbi:hypothetical protein EDB85DRAFT_2156499 [Lactarius pseudohatsudake]|nr:hypothetical protein EDB85DRAFT_2156499 [Lactarius pseudohatsudake]